MREFRQAILRPDVTVEVWASFIEAQIRQQVITAEAQRHWEAAEESLSEARKLFPDSNLLAALSTQLNDLRRGTNETLQFLEKAQADGHVRSE